MSAAITHLALEPQRCDGCGRCVPVCPHRALRVGGGYLYIDRSACDECLLCVDACARKAITRRQSTGLSAMAGGTGGAKVVVGSRAEAKALRRAAKSEGQDLTVERRRSAAPAASGTRTASAAGSSWTMLDAGIVMAVMLAALLVTRAVVGSEIITSMPPSGQAGARAGILVGFFTVQMVTLSLLARRHGRSLELAVGTSPKEFDARRIATAAGLVVMLAIATRAASYGWGVLARAIGWQPPDSSALTSVFGVGGFGLLLSVIALVVLGPIAEELVFRGVLLGSFGAQWGMWPAIVATAVLFAAYHATAWTMVPLFVLGVALGWLAWSRGSVRSAIALHALYNGIVVAAAYWLAR